MAAIVQTQANALLDVTLGVSALTAPTTPMHIRLTTTAPTATTAGTELTGTGYTAGGSAISFNSAAAGSTTGPTATISWTNSSGSTWSIVGCEIWDTAATPVRWWFGTFTGQPISVANGNIFQIATGGITVTLS